MSFPSSRLAAQIHHGLAALALLLSSVLVSACGGADSADASNAMAAATETSATALDTEMRTASALAVNASMPTGWTECAPEYKLCSFSGRRVVRYGTSSAFATTTATNGVMCGNEVFGDPAYGMTKSCWYGELLNDAAAPATPVAPAPTASESAAAAAAVTTWSDCAAEGQKCSFTGQRIVRYGTSSQLAYGTFNGGVACTNDVFGDPAYAMTKRCSYAGVATAPVAIVAPPVVTPPVVIAPVVNTPAVAAPVVTTPAVTAPVVAAPVVTAPAVTTPVVNTPAVAVPVVTAPVVTAPVVLIPASPLPVAANAPLVLNAPMSSKPGDVIGLHGDNFGTNAQVWMDTAFGARQLDIINRVGTNYVAARIPADATGALIVRVVADGVTGAQVKLNATVAYHLDAMTLAPGGAFRVFGRNLIVVGGKPTVTVNGMAATVNVAQSNEHMLVAVAPTGLAAGNAAKIVVDNGNGSGSTTLDRVIDISTSGSGDPFALGVGWAAAFSNYSTKTIAANADSRLPSRMLCNGTQDDAPALQAAVDLAASSGGGVVTIPAGSCRIGNGIGLKSNVVISGAGKSATTLIYESIYPVSAVGIDLAGVRNLTLTNRGSVKEGPLLKDSTRVFLQNLVINLRTSRMMFLSGNKNFVFMGTDINQAGGIDEAGPYTVHGSSGFVFSGNVTRWVQGASTFGATHDAYFFGNRFIRDVADQDAPGTVHSFTIDFAYRIAIVGNSFEVANGPVRNKTRNDGETILTEGGGRNRTENIGTATNATATSITDTNNVINVDPFRLGSMVENYGVAIVSGKGAGQSRRVMSYQNSTMTVDKPWAIVPDTTSRYATFVWGLEKSLIKGNSLSQNPRGIWLYHTAAREVDIIGNDISEGGGIYLRSYVNVSTKSFMPIWNVRIANNKVSNSTGNWMSHINATFVNPYADPWGIGNLGLEIRDNDVAANTPNATSMYEENANTEGYVNMMRIESANRYKPVEVQMLGTIFQRNACTNCDAGFRLGTAAGGTVVIESKVVNAKIFLDDWATTNDGTKSTFTVIK